MVECLLGVCKNPEFHLQQFEREQGSILDLEGGKGRGKRCNYSLTSKDKYLEEKKIVMEAEMSS